MNKLFSKIIGASLAIAMMIGVGAGVNASKAAKPVDADQSYSNREIAFTASSLPDGLTISNSGGFGSSTYRMANNNYATIDASVLFNEGEALSSENMTISPKIGTYGSWSGAKTAKYTVAFLDSEGATLSTATGNSKNGMSSSAAYSNGPAVSLSKPNNPSEIAKLKITFTNLTTPGSGAYLRFQGVQLTYATETLNTAAITSTTLTAEDNKKVLDLGETVQLIAIVKDANEDVINNAAVTFSSSDETVATVDQTGLVTASSTKYGSTTITAAYAGDANHNPSSAVIVIRVSNPNVSTFVIADVASDNNWQSGTAYSSLGTIGSVSISGSGTNDNRKYYDSGKGTWRFYSSGSGQITISTSSGYLKKITLVTDGTNYFTTAPANWTYSEKVFTASNKTQTSVTLQNGGGTTKIEQIEVQIGHAYSVAYDANGGTGTMTDSNSPYDAGSTVTVLTNTFVAPTGKMFDHWNTQENDNGTNYDATNTFTINANTTLYAQWVDAGNDPYVDGVANSISGVFTGQQINVTFSYGNFDQGISVVSDDETIFEVVNTNTADENNSSATLNLLVSDTANLLFKNGLVTVKSIEVTITQTTLSLNKNATSISRGMSETLVATTNVGEVEWTSNNAKVTVDGGVVSVAEDATAGSIVTVTARSSVDANVYATCLITITYPENILQVATSISEGDTVFFTVLDNIDKQYSGPSTGSTIVGLGDSFSGRPDTSKYPFLVEAGNEENTFAFKVKAGTNAGKFINWTAGNSLTLSDTKDNNSSWSVTIDGEGAATIKNHADNARVLWWNVTNPRFACYTDKTAGNDYKNPRLWKYISPETCLEGASSIKTISGVESNDGATVNNVALRFGAIIPAADWSKINETWPITEYGIVFARQSMLTARGLSSAEAVFRHDEDDTFVVRNSSGNHPKANGDNYVFTARLNLDEEDYDEIFYAAPYVLAGDEYYFLPEMHYSVRTLAEECYNNGGSSLSQTALATLKGNN